jgi:hypothetical protein
MLLLTRPFGEPAPVAGRALLQVLVASMIFPVLFRLQQKGGPVLLRQIGYVAAADWSGRRGRRNSLSFEPGIH